MRWASTLAVLFASALALGQKFEVTNSSAPNSPISFSGTGKVSKTGTTCTVTMRNNSVQSLLALEVTGEVTSPQGPMQPTGLSYDGFFKENGIPPGMDFDLVSPGFFDGMNQAHTYANGVEVKPPAPKKHLICHAVFEVRFFQLEDGSTSGDYEIKDKMIARRAKSMETLSHLIQAYDTGGQAALAAALGEPDAQNLAYRLDYEAKYFKVSLIDLARKKLAAAQKKRASGIF